MSDGLLHLFHFDETTGATATVDEVTGEFGDATTGATSGATGAGGKFDNNLLLSGAVDKAWNFVPSSVQSLDDLTLEFWYRASAVDNYEIIYLGASAAALNNRLSIDWRGGYVYVNGSTTKYHAQTKTAAQLYHIALVRKDDVVKLFVDGVSLSGCSFTDTYTKDSEIYLNDRPSGTRNQGDFDIDELALYAYAKYDEDFTPPTEPIDPSPIIEIGGTLAISGTVDEGLPTLMAIGGILALSGTTEVTAGSIAEATCTLALSGTVETAAPRKIETSGTLALSGTVDALNIPKVEVEIIGGLALRGTVTSASENRASIFGTLALSGSADIGSSSPIFQAAGKLALSGNVSVVPSSVYAAVGTLALSGTVEVENKNPVEIGGTLALSGSVTIEGDIECSLQAFDGDWR